VEPVDGGLVGAAQRNAAKDWDGAGPVSRESSTPLTSTAVATKVLMLSRSPETAANVNAYHQ
jgi:hypothetical protein